MVTLRGITWDHPRGFQALAASVQPYFERAGVRVEWHNRSLKDFGDAPIDQLARDFDLLIVDHPHIGIADATDCLIPLDEHVPAETLQTLAEQSAGPSHASYFYAGHQWALAIDAAVQASVYRPDLLDGGLPSQDWDEVVRLGRRLQGSGRWIGLPLVPTDCICAFLSLCASLRDPPGAGDDLLRENAVGHHALELLVAFAEVGHPDSLSWNPIRMLDHMSAADDLVYCPLTFTYTNYSRDGYAPQRVRFTNVPGVRGAILGGAGYAVSSFCRQTAAAVDYGLWLCSADVQRTLYVDHGGQPGNGAAWRDEHANTITHNFFRDTWDTLAAAYVRPRFNGYHRFQEQAGHVIQAMLRDRTSVITCLTRLKVLYREAAGG